MSIFGTSGLIKANMKTYFKAREKGLNVDEALALVIQSRYPLSKRNQRNVTQMLNLNLNGEESEKEKVNILVREILLYEYQHLRFSTPKFSKDFWGGLEPSRLQIAESQVDEFYESMQRKYKI